MKITWITLLSVLLTLSAPTNAAVISLSPTSAVESVGSQFVIDVNVSGLATGQAVSAFDLDIVFNPLFVAATQVNFGTALGVVDVDQFTSSIIDLGRIDFAAVSLASGASLLALQGGPFTLAQIVFDAIGAGSTAIELDPFTAPGILLGDADGNVIDVSLVNNASVRVADTIPEPGSLMLVMVAFPALLLVRVRRQRRSEPVV